MRKSKKPTLIKDIGVQTINNRKYKCGEYLCNYCGNTFIAKHKDILKRIIGSCGCLKGIKALYGTKHHLYGTWSGMLQRCNNPNNLHYKNYGGRGITVCAEWHSADAFIGDMLGTYEVGLTLDRINSDLGYSKDNCRWATKEVQAQNTGLNTNNKSGFRGVCAVKGKDTWVVQILANSERVALGGYTSALEAGKVYESYVRINRLEHNFTPALDFKDLELLNTFLQYCETNNIPTYKIFKSFINLL